MDSLASASCDIVVCYDRLGFSVEEVGHLTYEKYGAVGNGVVNDALAIQAAVNASAAGGGPILAGAKTYKSNSGILVPSNVSIINAPGTVYDFSGAPGTVRCFAATGTAASPVAVIGNLTAGQTVITVAAGAETGFPIGSMVKVWSEDIFDPAKSDTRRGELNYVQSVAAGQITLRTPLNDSMGSSPKIQQITPVVNVSMFGGEIRGSGANAQDGWLFLRGENCTLEKVRFSKVNGKNIYLEDCYECGARDCKAADAVSATGWALVFSLACYNCYYENCRVRNAWRGVATVGANTESGVVRDCRVSYCRFDDCPQHGIFVQGNADELLFEGNLITGSGSDGIKATGRRIRAINNKIRRAGNTAIVMELATVQEGAMTAIGNIIADCAGAGITVTVTAGPPVPEGYYGIVVGNNRIERAAFTALSIADLTNTKSRAISVQGNVAVDCATSTSVHYSLAGVRNFAFNGNVARGCGTGDNAVRVQNGVKGTIVGNTFHFVDNAAAGATGIHLDTCVGIQVEGNCVETGGTPGVSGVRVSNPDANSRIVIGLNEFSGCVLPINPNTAAIVAGIVTLPYVSSPYAIQLITETVGADDVTSIDGLKTGQMQVFALNDAARPVTFKHNLGNLKLGADFTLNALADRACFQQTASSDVALAWKADNA